MIVTLIAVISMDGNITDGDTPGTSHWTSLQDAAHFRKQLAKSDAIVIGRATYDIAKPVPQPGKLRIVMTRQPQRLISKPGMLEFTDKSPQSIHEYLHNAGKRSVLLVGGSQIYSLFINAGLVDDMYLTIEPVLLGEGTPFFSGSITKTDFRLKTMQQLNSAGSLLLHYIKH